MEKNPKLIKANGGEKIKKQSDDKKIILKEEKKKQAEEKKKQIENMRREMEEKKKQWEDELIKEGYGYIKEEDRPNPYDMPQQALWNGVTLHGARLMNFNLFGGHSPVERVELIRGIPIRDDDILIASFPKSGTHWVWEIANMLMNNTVCYEERSKEFTMLEFCDKDVLAQDKSPRILNCHLPMPHLPVEVLQKKTKIIHVVRNPKSVMVAFHLFTNQFCDKKFSMESFMRTLLDNNLYQKEHQLEYLRQMSSFQKNNPDHPIITIYYEQMKKNPVQTTKELAEFLGVPNTEEFYQKVSEACGFENLKIVDIHKRKPGHLAAFMSKIQFYRKGTIDDWKNHLTVAQNEMMDAFIESEIKNGGLDYEFVYT